MSAIEKLRSIITMFNKNKDNPPPINSSALNDSFVTVHPLTKEPTRAWEQIKSYHIVQAIPPLPHDLPIHPHKVRVVCMSDTHSRIKRLNFEIPPGDIFIHAGDFSFYGDENEVVSFNQFLGSLPHKFKVVIAGNHELTFDVNNLDSTRNRSQRPPSLNHIKKKLTNCIYLEDSETEILGLKIYGSPWQPEHMGWAFNLPRGKPCLDKWQMIPDKVDILVTHSPPLGHGDYCKTGVRAGCLELLNTVEMRVKPKVHVFGHIHEGYGVTSNGITTFINASTCDIFYKPVNLPIIFDLDLPQGIDKSLQQSSS